jgi:hypothetical protein
VVGRVGQAQLLKGWRGVGVDGGVMNHTLLGGFFGIIFGDQLYYCLGRKTFTVRNDGRPVGPPGLGRWFSSL